MEMFKVGIEFNKPYVRNICDICGHSTNKNGASVTIEIPEADIYLNAICVACLDAGIVGAAASSREHANKLREWAKTQDILANVLESAGQYAGWIDRETFELAVDKHEKKRIESLSTTEKIPF